MKLNILLRLEKIHFEIDDGDVVCKLPAPSKPTSATSERQKQFWD